MKYKKLFKIIFSVSLASVILTQNCYAYIDPAATSYIIQIVAGIIVALGAVFGVMWSKIKRFFKKKDKEDTNDIAMYEDSVNTDADSTDYISAEDILNSKEGK